MNLAPITIFVYNRLKNTKATIEALQRNPLSKSSILYIYSDGPKNESDQVKVSEVRNYIKKTTGFKTINIYNRNENYGLKRNIIEGVSHVISMHGKVIVLEDDLVTSPYFLDFMNQGLIYYNKNERIQSISGYTMPLKVLENTNKDFYLGLRASSWGWATWDHVWNGIDWEVKDFDSFYSNAKLRNSFNAGGSDMSSMLKNNMSKKISSWAIVFCYDQWKKNRLTVFPTKSKIINFGFAKEASNTKHIIPEYQTNLDNSNKKKFQFDDNLIVDPQITKSFAYNFSYYVRIKNKLLNIFRN
ncbi:sugar transferase [Gelatiniphilus marinus]|uniref:Sugar transferase n=1 Tax=Gelatiniphilus marinus TaxID=1759464 RepID=A0ABW5JSX5_9FLAO